MNSAVLDAASEVLFGRQPDVSLVMRQLRKAPTERGPAIFVAGDAGIGKSSFLRACTTEASDFANVLALSRATRPDAMRTRLGSIGKRRPILVVVDDLDRISPEDLEIVDDLIEAAKRLPLLLVATLQRRSLTVSRIAVFVETALADGSSKHILPPLSFGDVRLLAWNLASSRNCELDGSVMAEIIATAEGNPRFVHELVSQAISESPKLAALIPAAATATAGAFKATVSPAEYEVLSVASLIGQRFCGSWLAGISGRDESIVTGALQAASDAGILRELPEVPDDFVFAQYAVRKAFGASLVSRRRENLHARIAQMLVRLKVEAPYDRVAAEHLAASGAKSAPTWLHKAGARMLEDGDGAAAAELYERAARLAADPPRRIEFLRASAEAYAAAGALERTTLLREELAQHFREDADYAALAATLLSLFFDYAVGERWPEASRAVEELSRLNFDDPTDIRIYTNMAWAIYLEQRGAMAEARAVFDRASAWAPAGVRGTIMRHLGSAFVSSRSRPFAQTMALFDKAIDASIEAKRPHFTAMSQILAFEVATTLGNMPEARDRDAACRLVLADLQQQRGICNTYAVRQATFCALSGDLTSARDAVRTILEVSNPGSAFELFIRNTGTYIAARTGDWHTIQSLFDPNQLRAGVERHDAEAWGELLRGFSDIAVTHGLSEELDACVHRLVEANFVDPHLWIQLTAAEYGRLADLPAAREQIVARKGGADRLVVAAALAMFDAHSARRQGRPMEAKRAAHRATESYRALDWPILESRALEIEGKVAAAVALYTKCAAFADVNRLRSKGARNKRRGAFAAPLTLREREVAALVERGLTNREIAVALRVSEETIHHHVTAILGKLGLRTRWQVSTNASRRESGSRG
jgi:DNA-binding CsgD family transcriptional regulator